MSMSKEKLVESLVALALYDTESGAITAWADAWKKFFSNAFANYTQANPVFVSDGSTFLTLGVNSVLGAGDESGAWVKVECLLTGEFELCEVSYTTLNYIITSDFLGQTAPPSTTLTDYEVTDAGIIVSALSTPEAAMASAMVGLSVADEAGNELQNGVTAWWAELTSSPSTYFRNATEIIAPLGLSGLAAALEISFDENIAVEPPISQADAMDNIADDFITANTGGTVTISAVTETIE